MQAIVSAIGTPTYHISQDLVELIQTTLNKSKYKMTNSLLFLNKAKKWLVKANRIQVYYDIINLYLSIPINKTLHVLIDQLDNDKDDLIKRTKLYLRYIYVLNFVLVNLIFDETMKLEY